MKSIVFLTTLLASAIVSAGTFYKVESLGKYPVNYEVGDVVYCTALEVERRITGGCVNLNRMEGYSVKVDSKGAAILASKDSGESVVVGKVDKNSLDYILDEISAVGSMSTITVDPKLEANILIRKSWTLNDSIGCSGVFDCDWRIMYQGNKISLEVKYDGNRLEKIRLN